MKKLLIFILIFAISLNLCACITHKTNASDNSTIPTEVLTTFSFTTNNPTASTEAPTTISTSTTKQTELIINNKDYCTFQGTIKRNTDIFPDYYLKLDEYISITLEEIGIPEYFDCDTLYFPNDTDVNGNYDFSKLDNTACTVTARLTNYRGGGNLYLLHPTITINGKTAETLSTTPTTLNESEPETNAPINPSNSLNADFYAEIFTYVSLSCVNYTEWWSNPSISYTEPTHYYLGSITNDNYSEKLNTAKQLIDKVYKIAYWEIRYRGYGDLLIGIHITQNDELYLCFDY